MLKRLIFVLGAEVLVAAAMAVVPLAIDNSFMLGLLTLLAIYGILLIGLDVTVGYLGQVNLAQAAFLGIGAYTAGIAVSRFGFSMFPALIAATTVGCIFGRLLAYPALRLDGPQFALSTLSFMALTTTVLNELEFLTKGAEGLQVPRPPILGFTLETKGFYWLCLLVFILVWMAMKNLLTSQWGRAFEALRDSPIATDAMGIGAHRHKAIAFTIGSGLGSLAGGLYAFNMQFLQPQVFVYELMVILLLGVVLGGRKSLWGVFVGATIIVLLPNLLSNLLLFEIFSGIGFLFALAAGIRGMISKTTKPFQAVAPIVAMGLLVTLGLFTSNIEDWRKAIFALMLFAVMVGLPEGLMGFAGRYLVKLFRIDPLPLPEQAVISDVLKKKETDGKPLLELQVLKKYFGGVKAIDGATISVNSGEIHGLIGPNGSGKSTVVNVISGLYAPTSGEILFQGKILAKGSLLKVANLGISRTFQNLQIFSELPVLDNVMVAMKSIYQTSLPFVFLGLGRKSIRGAQSESLAILDMVGLRDEARTLAKDLPYGAQRLLEIARALARRPDLLILDEPAAGLSQPDVKKLIKIIKKINELGITIILIEHHMEVVSEICHIVTVLDYGKVIALGKPDEIKRNPVVIEAYLGIAKEPEKEGKIIEEAMPELS